MSLLPPPLPLPDLPPPLPLPVIEVMQIPLPLPLPEPDVKVTDWFPMTINPVHCGEYEVFVATMPSNEPNYNRPAERYFWDGREWADKIPKHVVGWRGVSRARWVNIREANPTRSGWYDTRWPKGEKKARLYWVAKDYTTHDNPAAQVADVLMQGWHYANPKTGELTPFVHTNDKWVIEWMHDGAE